MGELRNICIFMRVVLSLFLVSVKWIVKPTILSCSNPRIEVQPRNTFKRAALNGGFVQSPIGSRML